MAQFNNERLRNLRIGINSYTEEELVLDVVGDVSIGGSIFDVTGSSGGNQYVLSSTAQGILWQSLTGPDGIGGVNVTTSNEDLIYNLPFVPVSSGTTAITYVDSTGLVYNPGTNRLGIGSTQPGSTLVVSSPSGYTANLLELNSKDGAPLRITNTARAGYSIETYDIAGSFSPTLTFRFGPGGGSLSNSGIGIWNNGGTSVVIGYGTGLAPYSSGYIALDGNNTKVKSLGFRDIATLSADVVLERDGSDVLAQRRSGIGQTFRIYNTYTSASQYERAYLGWNNNTFEIGVGTAGVSTARSISIVGAAGSNTGDTLQPLQINQTWTAGSGIATALTLNVTDTSSNNTNSRLLDLRVDGSSRFAVEKYGAVRANITTLGGGQTNDHHFGCPAGSNNGFRIVDNAGNGLRFSYYGFALYNTTIGFSPTNILTVPDVVLARDGAGVLAQRNGVGAGQTFRIYNTYTSATNFERANVGWTTNTFIVGTEKGSAGGEARQLELQTDGITRIGITSAGELYGSSFESFELDDMNGALAATQEDGRSDLINTLIPTFNYERVTITNPFRLMITVNGIPQSAFLNNTDYVFQSNFLGSNNGYTIDTDNNIKFTESIPSGSDIVARVLPSYATTRIKFYPFKPTDILLGY